MAQRTIYRQIDIRIWADEWFTELPIEHAMLWFLLLTGPQTSMPPGIMRATSQQLSVDSCGRVSEKQVVRGLAQFQKDGKIIYSESRGVIFVRNAMRYNMPANPNVVVGWRSYIQLIPDCEAKAGWIAETRSVLVGNDKLSKAFGSILSTDPKTPKSSANDMGNGSRNGSPNRSPNRSRIQEQEQEQEQEGAAHARTREAPRPARPPADASHQKPTLADELADLIEAKSGKRPARADHEKRVEAILERMDDLGEDDVEAAIRWLCESDDSRAVAIVGKLARWPDALLPRGDVDRLEQAIRLMPECPGLTPERQRAIEDDLDNRRFQREPGGPMETKREYVDRRWREVEDWCAANQKVNNQTRKEFYADYGIEVADV